MAELNWLALAIGAPLALVFTLGVRTLAARQGWMDRPGAARIHAVPVPRLGGVAMYAAFVITVLVVAWPLDGPTLGLLLGATLLVVFIVVDDLRGCVRATSSWPNWALRRCRCCLAYVSMR